MKLILTLVIASLLVGCSHQYTQELPKGIDYYVLPDGTKCIKHKGAYLCKGWENVTPLATRPASEPAARVRQYPTF